MSLLCTDVAEYTQSTVCGVVGVIRATRIIWSSHLPKTVGTPIYFIVVTVCFSELLQCKIPRHAGCVFGEGGRSASRSDHG